MAGGRSVNQLAEVNAVILAGGLGTRLRSVVADRPKVLAEIHDRPFLTYLFDQLIGAGITRVVLCSGYLSQRIRDSVGDNYRSLCIAHSEEPIALGTAGALRLALPKLQSDPVLVMNGDSYCATVLENFWISHQSCDAAATLLLARVSDTARFGRVQLGPGHEVIDFQERGSTSGPGFINAGIYLIQKALIAEIAPSRILSLEREVFPSWIGRRFYGFETEAKFLDIGTPEALAGAEAFFLG